MKRIALFLSVALLLIPSIGVVWAEGEAGEGPREFSYAGMGRNAYVDAFCQGVVMPCDEIPRQLFFAVCDQGDGIGMTGVHGVGGGEFCGVSIGKRVTVTVADELVEVPRAAVYCPTGLADPVLFPHQMVYVRLGTADPTWSGKVPADCREGPAQGGPRTDLRVVVMEGAVGTVSLGSP